MQLYNGKIKVIPKWFLITIILCSSFMTPLTTTNAAGVKPTDARERLSSALAGGNPTSSRDAYVQYDDGPSGKLWTIGTSQIEKVIRLQNGKFQMTSLVNKLTGGPFGKEYMNVGEVSDEFAIKTVIGGNTNGLILSGSDGIWSLEDYSTALGSQGELILSVSLTSPTLRVAKNYQILPDTGVIEEWVEYTNLSSGPATYAEPSLIRSSLMSDAAVQNVIVYRMIGDKVSSSPKHTLTQEAVKINGLTTIEGSGADVSHPFVALQYKDTQDGVFFTWDYTGKWQAKVGNDAGITTLQATVYNRLNEENWIFSLNQNETVSMPLSRTGVFIGDTDDMGNAITDYQYKYKWENTNEDFMNIIRFGGYGSDPELIFQKVNSNRYIGGDMIWIDDGWQTNLGDWEWKEGMPIEKYQEYIVKNSQVLGLWMPPWGAEQHAQLMKDHPDWYIEYSSGMDTRKTGLDTSNPEVVDYIRSKVNKVQAALGGFMLKTDFNQYKDGFSRAQGVMQVMANFKLDHPDQGLHICSDGAGVLNPGSAALSELILLQDGTPAYSDGYYASMLYPIDKILTSRGRGDIGSYSKSNRAMLSYAMTVAGKTNGTTEELEPIRQDMDLYRYLKEQGIMGRYVQVYRPSHTLEDNRYYFVQKMNKDGDKGYITVRFDSAYAGVNITLTPKGLNPAAAYTVSTLEGGMASATKSGAEWMSSGITLTPLQLGEVIFLNLEDRPGSGNDQIAPAPPANVSISNARYMDRSGIEITWDAGADNNWISYYEVFKNGQAYDKVSKGMYYFDINGTLNDQYSIRTVDGDGNASNQTDAVEHAPSIQPAVAEFDKAPNQQTDVVTELTWNHATQVTDIKLNDATIGSHSYVVGQTQGGRASLTIKKELLAAQNVGNLELTVEFDQGYKQLLIVQIVDKSGITSGDAYVRFEDLGSEKIWTMGTDQIEKAVRIQNSKFIMTSLVNKLVPNGGKEYSTHPKTVSDEFTIKPVVPGNTSAPLATGNDSVWTYESHSITKGDQGELILSVSVTGKSMRVTRNYQILPDTGVIEEWTDYTNLKQTDAIFAEPRLVRYRVMSDAADKVDLYQVKVNKTGGSTEQDLVKQPVNKTSLTTIESSDTETNHPFIAMQYRDGQDGLFFTWDYSGKWTTKVGNNSGMTFVQVAVYNKLDTDNWTFAAAPNETISTPVSRVGVFMGDTDDLGNAITDYQYKYKWSDTNEAYLNLIQYKSIDPDADSVFESISNNRYIGGDLVWLEDGWQTYAGDWVWKDRISADQYQHYARASSQSLGLWLPPWGAEQSSQLRQDHPEWFIEYPSGTDPRETGLDTSKSEVIQYIQQKINTLQAELGRFSLKTDFNHYKDGYSRAQGVLQTLENYKQAYPDQGLHISSNGSDLLHPGSAAYSEMIVPQEDKAGISDGYYTSLLYPIDKLVATYGQEERGSYTNSSRAALSYQMTVTGSADQENLERLRQDADLYRYLRTQGVMGRYVRVYRPETNTNDKYFFVQKVSQDGGKSYITVRFEPSLEGSTVTVYPKGLNNQAVYTISTLEGGKSTEAKTGTEWMSGGIVLSPLQTGEVIFMNLEGSPGSGLDQIAPHAPELISVTEVVYMDHTGMEMVWNAGSDNNWISYYEIEKNGVSYDKVSKGTRYFDEEGLSSDTYRIRTVDGDGNTSEYIPTAIAPAVPSISPSRAVFDKNPEKQADVLIDVEWNSASEVVTIDHGGVTVTEDVYYSVTGNLIMLKKEYLAMQEVGDIGLSIAFDTGDEAELTISILDTSVDPVEPPELPVDEAAPVWPADKALTASHVSKTSLALSWTSARDNFAVSNYKLFMNGSEIATVTGDVYHYMVRGLAPGTQYTFKTEAGDAASNWSTDGPSTTITTQAESSGGGWTPSPTPVPSPTPDQVIPAQPEKEADQDKVEPIESAEPSVPAEPVSPKVMLIDIHSHWARASIEQAVELGFVTGYTDGSFKPNASVTRAEITAMLARALKLVPVDSELGFVDKSSLPLWARPFIQAVAEAGIVSGYTDGTFRANKELTRAELVAIMVRALGLEVTSDKDIAFSDAGEVAAWAKPYVAAALEKGLVRGDGTGKFHPNVSATRAEAITMILAMLNYEG